MRAEPPSTGGPAALSERIAAVRWYHTLELAPGVVTEGFFDHRPYLAKYGLPADLSGQRAIDVGSQDGFWAFELERRGATVTALDVDRIQQLDWPPRSRPAGDEPRGDRFRFAAEARNSAVRWVGTSIYETAPEELGGTFDLVFCGSVLIHLRDPMLALERMAALCRDRLILAEEYSRLLERLPRISVAEFRGEGPHMTWWRPTTRTWLAMVRVAGFDEVCHHSRFRLAFSQERRQAVPHTVIHARGRAA